MLECDYQTKHRHFKFSLFKVKIKNIKNLHSKYNKIKEFIFFVPRGIKIIFYFILYINFKCEQRRNNIS